METPKKSVAAAASSSSVASTAAPPGSKSGTSTSSSNSNAATTTTAATTTATINSALAATAAAPCGKEAPTEAQRNIQRFWPGVMREIQQIEYVEPGNQLLPLARIKKIMKLDEEVKMISSDAPLLFSKAIEIFIQELTLRAWLHTEHNKRRTLQRSDIAMAITKYDQFDFLIDIVPRDEIKGSWKVFDGPAQDECAAGGGGGPASTGGGEAVASASTATTSEGAAGGTNGTADDMQYIMQLAQQHRLVQPGTDKGSCTATTNTTSSTATTSSLTNGATTVLDLATVMTGTQQLHQLSTVAAATKPAKGVVAGTEQETAGATLLPSPAQPTIQTATGQSLILANGGAGAPGGIANGSGQLVPASQSVQLLQHVMTPTGEITQIPISIPQSQLNFLRTAGPGGAPNSGQPFFIQTAPMQSGPTIIHTGPTSVFLSANQLQQLQQQQQQQQNNHNQTQQQQQCQQQLQSNHQHQRD
ncbi:nuclear transcription factor Y subunit gamma [Anopheles gambiae]|uniref:nuclear transcription factor Y subunit gamma n=1 Tax=Anopheles gambiae TaxID=7165 RepID=UPI002AC96A69|nr:nuclear transcription factor Y subunit gamma [Anopheles gambiae]